MKRTKPAPTPCRQPGRPPTEKDPGQKVAEQFVETSFSPAEKRREIYGPAKGNEKMIISTGSTLLDLEISGKRVYGGGIPAGILMEISGPSGCGKTVMLCEMAGNIQNTGGEVMFKDPEARLEKQFARMFGFNSDEADYGNPDTVPEIFAPVRDWRPDNPDIVNGIFADSLAALSTEMELDEGDKMGMRRAKEFSQECRKTCRHITRKNYLMACSNQLRDTGNTFGESKDTPGGNAIPYYSSLRLRFRRTEKVPKKIKLASGRELSRIIGVKSTVEVWKSSVGDPYGTAPVFIIFAYGIDDIRANLQWYKDMTKETKYWSGPVGLDDAVAQVEQHKAEIQLRTAVIDLWLEIQQAFKPKAPRTRKQRFTEMR